MQPEACDRRGAKGCRVDAEQTEVVERLSGKELSADLVVCSPPALEQRHVAACLCEQDCGGRPGKTATDDQHVRVVRGGIMLGGLPLGMVRHGP